MNEHRIHQVFVVSVLLKGAHAIIECIGGLVLAIVNTNTISSLVNALTQDELVKDPDDFIAIHLRAFAQHLSVSSQEFYAFYLLSHGAIKVFLVLGLLSNRLWAYPASLVALSLFIIYQVYRFLYTNAIGLVVLTALDLVVIWLVWHEYRLMLRRGPTR